MCTRLVYFSSPEALLEVSVNSMINKNICIVRFKMLLMENYLNLRNC